MPWYVYILRCADNSLYTGVTTDVDRRFAQHLSGKAAKYTRAHKPEEVVYAKACTSRSEAQAEEARIKKLSRLEKNELLARS